MDAVTRTFCVHAAVEGADNAVADDWIRVRIGNRPTTYMSYITTGDIEWTRHHRPPRRTMDGKHHDHSPVKWGTGPIRVWVKELDCGTMFFSSLDTPRRPTPVPRTFSIDPVRFISEELWEYELPVVIYRTCPRSTTGYLLL